MLEAGELLSSYVTHGALKDDTQFDGILGELAGLARWDRKHPVPVWRVVLLTPDKVAALRDGASVSMRPRRFGSWTRDEGAVRLLLRARHASTSGGGCLAVLRKTLGPETWALDVEAMYRKLGWDHPDVGEWSQYVQWEREVVVSQEDAGWSVVRPEEVVSLHPESDRTALWPAKGEVFWNGDWSECLTVDAVPDAQPEAEDGVFTVSCRGETRKIIWDRRFNTWDTAPEPGCEPGI